MTKNNQKWVPEIFYEEPDGNEITSQIPFIAVPDGEQMPPLLFIFESRETGEFEPDQDGNESPVSEIDLHQYANMTVLKEKLSEGDYDKVRIALDLEPMSQAMAKGLAITKNVLAAVDASKTV
jgi:hypothetical protein